jgi:hypothetical protein
MTPEYMGARCREALCQEIPEHWLTHGSILGGAVTSDEKGEETC